MSVTIKDVAKAAGVSYSTVSKALRDSPLVKQPTKDLIINVANQLGYEPNAAARSLVSKRSFTIGVVWPTIERVAHAALITSLNKKLEELSYTTLISINEPEFAFKTFNQHQVDAILMFDETGHPLNLSSKAPVVIYGIVSEDNPFTTIDANRHMAIFLAYKHLYEIGHRKISYIGYLESDRLQMEKVSGFNQAVSEFHTPPFPNLIMEVEGLEQYDGYESMRQVLESSTKPTAIISGSHDLTRGILRAIQERNLSVPHDFSLISYDYVPETKSKEIELTTVGVPIDTITENLADVLMEIIDENEVDKAIYLQPKLKLSNTCKPISRS